jgi:hypothetical protein
MKAVGIAPGSEKRRGRKFAKLSENKQRQKFINEIFLIS